MTHINTRCLKTWSSPGLNSRWWPFWPPFCHLGLLDFILRACMTSSFAPSSRFESGSPVAHLVSEISPEIHFFWLVGHQWISWQEQGEGLRLAYSGSWMIELVQTLQVLLVTGGMGPDYENALSSTEVYPCYLSQNDIHPNIYPE